MKKSRFTEAQIISILKEQEQGQKVADLCRKHGISDQTFYNWKSKYGGMDVDELKRLKDLEQENARLKKMVANQSLEIDIIKDLLKKKF
jgi:putative transposase